MPHPARSGSLLLLVALVALPAGSGCGPEPPPQNPHSPPVILPDAGPSRPAEPESAAGRCPPRSEPAQVTRDELRTFLDRTFPVFLQGVRTAPVFDAEGPSGGGFQGFRIVALDAALRCTLFGVREGDIVVSVNGLPLQTPDDGLAAWNSLYEASEITLSLVRGGVPESVTVIVADAPLRIDNRGVSASPEPP